MVSQLCLMCGTVARKIVRRSFLGPVRDITLLLARTLRNQPTKQTNKCVFFLPSIPTSAVFLSVYLSLCLCLCLSLCLSLSLFSLSLSLFLSLSLCLSLSLTALSLSQSRRWFLSTHQPRPISPYKKTRVHIRDGALCDDYVYRKLGRSQDQTAIFLLPSNQLAVNLLPSTHLCSCLL